MFGHKNAAPLDTTRLVTFSGGVRTRSTTPTGGRLLPSQESKLVASGFSRRTVSQWIRLKPSGALVHDAGYYSGLCACRDERPVVGRHRQSSSALTRCRTGHKATVPTQDFAGLPSQRRFRPVGTALRLLGILANPFSRHIWCDRRTAHDSDAG